MGQLAKLKESKLTEAANLLEKVVLGGNLAVLQPKERLQFYQDVCQSLGLNPLTRPFEYLTLDGKLCLYARKDCTDQLRKLHTVSIASLERNEVDGYMIVTARATMPDGRMDCDIGAVPITFPQMYWDWVDEGGQRRKVRNLHPQAGKRLDGEEFCNAVMKAGTKAKRRVTLSICGLGFVMDDTEVDDVEGSQRVSEAEFTPEVTVKSIRVLNPQESDLPPCPHGVERIEPVLKRWVDETCARANKQKVWDVAYNYVIDTVLPTVPKDTQPLVQKYAEWLLTVGKIQAAQAVSS